MCAETKTMVPGDVVVIPQPCDTSSERDEYLPITVDGLSCTRHVHYQCAPPDAPPSGGSGSGTTTSGGSVTPAPNVSIPFVLAIDGRVRTLKQFFNVALAVANQADPSFLVNNLQATLSSDSIDNDGILRSTLPVVKDAPPLPDIHGGQSASTAWVVRGDKVGVHVVKVAITGRLQPGDIPISTVQFATVIVNEPPQLDLVLHHPASVHNGDAFALTAQVTNRSTTTTAQLAAVEIALTGTAELASGTNARQDLGDIPPGQVRFASWNLISRGDGRIQACTQQGGASPSFNLDIGGTPCPDLVPSDTTHENVPAGKVVILGTNVPVRNVSVEVTGSGSSGAVVTGIGVTDANGFYHLSHRVHGSNLTFHLRLLDLQQWEVRQPSTDTMLSLAPDAAEMPTLAIGATNRYDKLTQFVHTLKDTSSSAEELFAHMAASYLENELAIKALLDSAAQRGEWGTGLRQIKERYYRLYLAQKLLVDARVSADDMAYSTVEPLTEAISMLFELLIEQLKIKEKVGKAIEERALRVFPSADEADRYLSALNASYQLTKVLEGGLFDGIVNAAQVPVKLVDSASVGSFGDMSAEFIVEYYTKLGTSALKSDVTKKFLAKLYARFYGFLTKHNISVMHDLANGFTSPDSAESLVHAFEKVDATKIDIDLGVENAHTTTEELATFHELLRDVTKDLNNYYDLASALAISPAAPVAGTVAAVLKTLKTLTKTLDRIFVVAQVFPAPAQLLIAIPHKVRRGVYEAFDQSPPLLPASPPSDHPKGRAARAPSAFWRSRAFRAAGVFTEYQQALARMRVLVVADSFSGVRIERVRGMLPSEAKLLAEVGRSTAVLRGAAENAFGRHLSNADTLFASYSDSTLSLYFNLWPVAWSFYHYSILTELEGGISNPTYAQTKQSLLELIDNLSVKVGNLAPTLAASFATFDSLGLTRPTAYVDSVWATVNGRDTSRIGATPAAIQVHARAKNASDVSIANLRFRLQR